MKKARARSRKPVRRLIARLQASQLQSAAIVLIFAIAGIVLLLALRAAPEDFSPRTLATAPAQMGQAYSATLTYPTTAAWSVVSGTLPPGLTMSGGGRISGTPTQAGAFTFVVKAQPSQGAADLKPYTILVYPPDAYGYRARADSLINAHITTPYPPFDLCDNGRITIPHLYYATAALWKNQNVSDANSKLATVRWDHMENNCGSVGADGNSLFLSYLLRPYFLYNSGSSYFPGRITPAVEDHLRAQIWEYARRESNIKDTELSRPEMIWEFTGSENLDFQEFSFNLLSAQIFKDHPNYASRTYPDGKTPREHYEAWRGYWHLKLDAIANHGNMVENAAPPYFGYNISAMITLYNFAEDPLLRKRAEITLDIIFADYANAHLDSVWGTGSSRSRNNIYTGTAQSMTGFGRLMWGPQHLQSNHALSMATSGYFPPDAAHNVGSDTQARGTYEYTLRRPGRGDTLTSLTESVRYYHYVTPGFIMAGPQLCRCQYNAGNKDLRWQGIIFNSANEARVFPLIDFPFPEKISNSFYSVQKKGAWLAYPNPDYQSTHPIGVYFYRDLDVLNEEDGWIFAKEGNAYVAVRPQIGGYSWVDPLKNMAADRSNRYIRLNNPASPIIFEAVLAAQFNNDFNAFKAKVKSNARSYVNNAMNYTASDGTLLTLFTDFTNYQAPRINGSAIDFSPPKLFDSPYIQSGWLSKVVTVSRGNLRATYDLRDFDNPTKTVVQAAVEPNPAPAFDTMTPTSGPTSGGTAVTINGSNFVTGASVHFGFAAASGVKVVNATTITATTPSVSSTGPINVVVTNPDGQQVIKNSAFTYTSPTDTEPPTVSIVAPTAGESLTGNVMLAASAQDNIGVARADYFLDGTAQANKIGVATRSGFGWLLAWDTSSVANGNHVLRAKAYDAAGNVGTSPAVTVTIDNRSADINQDGVVNLLDFSLLASKFGQTTDLGRADINRDGVVNLLDFSLLASNFGT